METGDLWNVVLAGGEGTRMASLTRLLYGESLPKQFATFGGQRTMLQETLDRIAPLAPARRTIVVVGADQEAIARDQLAELPEIDLAVQPHNVGTGPGVLFPLARILARDPEARVVFFPADHHFTRPQALIDAVPRLLAAADAAPSGVALTGVPADRADTDLGWLRPGRALGAGAREVAGFVEKPSPGCADLLLGEGALWNTLVFGGHALSIWRLVSERLPKQGRRLGLYAPYVDGARDASVLWAVYLGMPPADLSRDVFEAAPGLAMVSMPDAGWSDWGTPTKLFASLEGTERGAALAARILGVSSRVPARRAPATTGDREAAA